MTERLTNSDKLSLLSEAVEITSLTNKERIGLLGAVGLMTSLGFYDASQDEYDNPEHVDSVWKSVN